MKEHRITLDLSEKEFEALSSLSDDLGMSKAGVLRQGLRMYQLVRHHEKQGNKIRLVYKNSKVVREFIFL